MEVDTTNQTSPNIDKRVSQSVDTIVPVHTYSVAAFGQKKKAKAILNWWYEVASLKELTDEEVTKAIIEAFEEKRKKGRYHSWFFAPKREDKS